MINLLVTLDSNYINPLCSMLCSITISNPNESFNLYVAHSGLTDSDFEKISYAVRSADFEIYPIKLENSLFENAPTEKRISKETYYRIFAPLYLPKSVNRILYLDPDTIVIKNLSEFYNSEFYGNLIIGARHFSGAIDRWNKFRLFMKESPNYINAGILLMDIRRMRKTFEPEKVYSIIRRKIPVLFLADQDVINILYDGKIGYDSEFKINLDERTLRRIPKKDRIAFVKTHTVIIHFNGKYKPWKPGYKGMLNCFYEEYGFSPEFNARCFYENA